MKDLFHADHVSRKSYSRIIDVLSHISLSFSKIKPMIYTRYFKHKQFFFTQNRNKPQQTANVVIAYNYLAYVFVTWIPRDSNIITDFDRFRNQKKKKKRNTRSMSHQKLLIILMTHYASNYCIINN